MIEIYAFIAAMLMVTGAMIGILTVLAVGIRREKKAGNFVARSPSRAASSARVLTGLRARQ